MRVTLRRCVAGLPAMIFRALAAICIICVLAPSLTVAQTSTAPIATNISGAVVVRSSTGGRHDLVTFQVLHPGDVIVTSLNSLAMVSLADVARVLLGPTTMARTYASECSISSQRSRARAITSPSGEAASSMGWTR